MTEPDKDKLTEVELELEQRKRLMDVFMLVETFDDREAVIAFCENIVSGGSTDEVSRFD